MIIQKQDYIEMYNEKIPDEFEGTCSPPIDNYVYYKFINEIFLASNLYLFNFLFLKFC